MQKKDSDSVTWAAFKYSMNPQSKRVGIRWKVLDKSLVLDIFDVLQACRQATSAAQVAS